MFQAALQMPLSGGNAGDKTDMELTNLCEKYKDYDFPMD